MRFYLAFLIAKIAARGIGLIGKFTGGSKGSNFPGELALKICPDFLGRVAKPKKIIAVTGTNGKTTTTNLIADALEYTGHKVLSNREGSNLHTGLASCFAKYNSLFNKSRADVAVLEIDERASLRIYPYVKPDYFVCTNLMRDSFKRNPHPYFIFDMIEPYLPDGVQMVLNGDDLISARLKPNNPRVYYGISEQPNDYHEAPNMINDLAVCPECQTVMKFKYVRYAHIGKAYCPHCGLEAPKLDVEVGKIDYDNMTVDMRIKDNTVKMKAIADSIFNIYNEAAVVAFLKVFGISDDKIVEIINNAKIVESRLKQEQISGINIYSTMVKGWLAPSCSAVFDYVRNLPNKKQVIITIESDEENTESVENLSYMYETDFEYLNDEDIVDIIIIGRRSNDYYFRLLMAGVPEEKMHLIPSADQVEPLIDIQDGVDVHILYDIYNMEKYQKIYNAVEKRISEVKGL